MAQIYGSAGASALSMGEKRYHRLIKGVVLPMLSLFGVLGLGLLLFVNGHHIPGGIVWLIFAGLVLILERKGLVLRKRILHAFVGAKSEQVVADALQTLPHDYHVFHDLEFPGFNIDHVVLGPNGLFLIETKSQSGAITQQNNVLFRNGKKFFKNFLKQTWRQTYALRDHLGPEYLTGFSIGPVLCFTNGYVTIRGQVQGITVLNVQFLTPYILSSQDQISSAIVERTASFLSQGMVEVGMGAQRDLGVFSVPKEKIQWPHLPRSGWLKKLPRPAKPVIYFLLIIVLYGLVLGNRGSVPLLLQSWFTSKVNLVSTHTQASQPKYQAEDFPLTHAVSATGVRNTIPFTFVEDLGQNVVLLFFGQQEQHLVMRATIRAHEILRTMLPQTELSCLLITGPAWFGFGSHFGDKAEAKRANILLSTATSEYKTSSSIFRNKGISCPITVVDKSFQSAFTTSGGFLKMK